MRRLILIIFSLIFCVSLSSAQSVGSLKAKFKSKDYSVSWGKAPFYPTDSMLEIGDGSGHGGSLRWTRFVPNKQSVDVIVVSLDEEWHVQKTRWPFDDISVEVRTGKLSRVAFRSLLNKVALAASAKLKPIFRDSIWGSSGDFWVSTRIFSTKGLAIDYDWAGYSGSMDAYKYAKPSVMVDLAKAAIKDVKFADHVLTTNERTWSSQRFINDWKRYVRQPFYWWVGERYIMLIGFIGDKTAIPALVSIMDLYSRPDRPDPEKRNSYYAVNALTRIIGEDVRDKPVEQMDLDTSRMNMNKLLLRASP